MGEERKVLYISIGINFLVGIVIGMVLFYGQLRTDPAVFEGGHTYDETATISDFFRVSWLNMLWLFAIFIAHNILPVPTIHPIIAVRGCACAFSAMYLLNFAGIKETAAAVVPQCLSVLPLLVYFSAEMIVRRRELVKNGSEPFSMRRKDTAAIFILSAIAGGIEVLFFRLFTLYLF